MKLHPTVAHTFKATVRHWSRPPYSYLIAVAAAALIAGFTILLPYLLAHRAAAFQATNLQAAAQVAGSTAVTLPMAGQYDRLTPGQSGTVKSYADSLRRQADDFNPALIGGPKLLPPILALPGTYPSRYVTTAQRLQRAQGSLRTTATADLQAAKRLLVHQSLVTSALVNVLSYSPRVDFAHFDAKSDDTKKRLQLAETGLAATHDTLSGLRSPDDPTLDQLVKRIGQLQNARDRLTQTGNVDDWSAAVSLAQADIVSNRDTYWSRAAADPATRLTADADHLRAAVTSWQELLAGRGLVH